MGPVRKWVLSRHAFVEDFVTAIDQFIIEILGPIEELATQSKSACFDI